ncbi:phosphotransferase enzyme family protein [Actinoplanes aureus]|uniref:Phosphotransferase n=1 Tax=Actinoplanes aureus TaxID=2792083 RepID=A0A931CIA9_9ACTN|nr:phosphotransferase [Actinoplanes aureus]MBG0568162.1 phosphotransferase [Actinoplanes aureus]
MFVEQRTRPVLDEVCRIIGYSPDEAVLLRHHTNAVYAVRDLVVKISPPAVPLDRIRRVVHLVTWLQNQSFPTVLLHPGVVQPLQINDHAITVWQRLNGSTTQPVTTGELGSLLRRLHALPLPPSGVPTTLDPITGIRRSIDSSAILTSDDRKLLTRRLEELAPIWGTAMPWGSGLIQSDPQIRNALRRDDGTPVLADWDSASTGPRVWDVATVAVHCRRFGSDNFPDFVTTYGRDPRGWERFAHLCALRELQMIATNARKSAPNSPAAAEVHRRIASLRQDPQNSTLWNIL